MEKNVLGENGYLENREIHFSLDDRDKDHLKDEVQLNQYLYSLYDTVTVQQDDKIGLFILESFFKIHRDYQSVINVCSITEPKT